MAKIAISLNEVLRDFLGQLTYVYRKYQDEKLEIKEGDITSFDLLKYFPKFENEAQLNRFLYMEAPLEIFGHADQLQDNLMNQFNEFVMDIEDDAEHEIEIVSREADKSIQSTFFFLSKTACRATRYRFVKSYVEQWDGADILITADSRALEQKPNGKISVKVRASYNQDIKADFEVDSILDIINNQELRNSILNTKITNYEEIN